MEAPRAKQNLEPFTIGSGPTLGYRLNVATAEAGDALALFGFNGYFRFLISPESPVEMVINAVHRVLAPPCLVWCWEGDIPEIKAAPKNLKSLVFHPNIVNGRFDYETLRHPDQLSHTEGQDLYFLQPFLQAAGQNTGCLEQAFAETPHFLRLWSNLRQLLGRRDFDGWPCQSRATVIELMFALRRVADNIMPATQLETRDELASRIAFAIQTRLAERLSVAQLAEEFATNRTSLNSRFHAAYDCGVIEFQRAARMRAAQTMLKDTFLPLEEIMARIGYQDPSAFGRAFRAHAGCAPSEYRNNHLWMLGRN